jgi:uncharacterized protein (DUF305 family)
VPSWRLRLLLLAAAAGATLTSCSGGDSPFAGRHASNAADGAFVHSMTEHEEATRGITRLGQRRALRSELRGIGHTMTTEEEANLRQLRSLARGLTIRGARPPAAAPSPVSAMLDLARVKGATSFDYEFMRTMIEQNQAAIAIAHREVRFGSDPEVKRLASAIEASRLKELERFRMWLHEWYGGEIQPGPSTVPPPGGGGDGQPSPTPPL